MNRLKQLRKGKYTQDEMADALNVGRSTYTKYESGAIQMGADVLVRLFKTYPAFSSVF
jgi:transcriptional regulator with XRE-family HTH domain